MCIKYREFLGLLVFYSIESREYSWRYSRIYMDANEFIQHKSSNIAMRIYLNQMNEKLEGLQVL